MTTVTNQTELRNALIALETNIVIANDFPISTTINIDYPVSIRSESSNSFTLLKSASFFGNILRVRTGGSLTLQNIILDGNKENHPIDNITNRSLIIMVGGTLILQENTIIQNNNTYLEGGGVYLSGNVSSANHFIMEDNAIIRGCYARTNGGGIIAAIRNNEDTLIIRDEALIEDNAANYGGGLYYRVYSEGVSGSLTLNGNPIFQNNQANNSGGAIAIFNIANNQENIHVSIQDTVLITNNTAFNHGGGIYFVGTNLSDQLDIGTVRIEENTAGGYGGGIYTSGVITTLEGARIYQNTGGTGGGLYLLTTQGGMATILSSTILSNHATNGASGSGGAIWINNRSTTQPYILQIRNSSLSSNSATALGGGLYTINSANGLEVFMENVDIKNNTAGVNGGGAFLADAGIGNIQVINSDILNNAANNYGGGIYISNENTGTATVFLSNTKVSNNMADGQGGGLRLSSGKGTVETTLENCVIEENLAHTNSGGGIWCGGNDIHLFLTKDTVINRNETVEGNGGGIYFNSKHGIVRLYDNSKITNNRANQNTNIIRNSGGGIYLVPGILYMAGNSEIANNKARYGGGIGTAEQATITLESGNIHGNEAILGGGIYNQASVIYFQGGSVYANQATIGGGIYNQT